MTYYGAKVIHPKTIKPLQNQHIPLYVRSFVNPNETGTMIADAVEHYYPPVIVIANDQALLHISTRDYSFVAEDNLSRIFSLLALHRIKVNMMQHTAISFSVCVNNIPERITELLNELKTDFRVFKDEGLELITVRHYQEELIDSLKEGKLVLLEERIRNTVQIVVKNLPKMERISTNSNEVV